MLQKELEERLGFELTEEGWETLNNMYMSCNLDKDEFAKLVKKGAKEMFLKPNYDDVNYKGIQIHYVDYCGMWRIDDIFISMARGSWYSKLEDAKRTIREVRASYSNQK